MAFPLSRRELLKSVAVPCLASALAHGTPAHAALGIRGHTPGWVRGRMTGAQALVETLQAEGTDCVFGIPGAQENELWDAFKSRGLGYLLVTHEFSAAVMADGYARSTGKPGVLSVVPGPGLTNSLSGLGEALLDSVPVVCVVGDVARGEKYRAFQVHDLPAVPLLQPVCKGVFVVKDPGDIPTQVRQAFQLACCGEPGPTAVVVPYNFLLEAHSYDSPPLAPAALPLDETACQVALGLLGDRKLRVGIYAGLGCMDHSGLLVQAAELLQAPVATSVSGKGVISDHHPLAVGWGYGPQGTRTAELTFKEVDLLLAVGVKYGEVSTGFYAIPRHRHLIHVDANAHNLGRVVPADVCVHADTGLFLGRVLAEAECLRRPHNHRLQAAIAGRKREECVLNNRPYPAKCGVDPMPFLLALRRCADPDALVYVDVSVSEHWAAEVFQVYQPRTYFNPTDNQAMGWSIPAALGGQRAFPGRQTLTITGDGCFLMSAMEISTAAREGLPVKFFVLDDQAYHYMQVLQEPAYLRTTATILARLDYAALAKGFGVGYHEVLPHGDLEAQIRGALCQPGPVLTRVAVEYTKRPVRWVEAAKGRFLEELSPAQKARFAARAGSRALRRQVDD